MVPDPSQRTREFSYDISKAGDHFLEVDLRGFLRCRSWTQNIIISVMAVILVFVLIYGVLVIGFKADMGSGTTARLVFLAFIAPAFIVFLLALGIPAAVKTLKSDLVISERGQENWKIVDEKDWERFSRFVKLAEERRKKMLKEAIRRPDGK